MQCRDDRMACGGGRRATRVKEWLRQGQVRDAGCVTWIGLESRISHLTWLLVLLAIRLTPFGYPTASRYSLFSNRYLTSLLPQITDPETGEGPAMDAA
jgi:hypothetical protein